MYALRPLLARLYDKAPVVESLAAIEQWRLLASISARMADIVRSEVHVVVVERHPYDTALAMFDDINSGRLQVATVDSTHPVWTLEDNVNFRLAHDWFGHRIAQRLGLAADFDWSGEWNAYAMHVEALYRHAGSAAPPVDALLTEVLGQAAYAIETGQFTVQKVAILK